jgi:hypothetical protein
MRKSILLLLVLAITTFTANSQNNFKKETNIGVKSGGTLNMLAFDPKVDLLVNFGYTGGLVFKHIEQKSLGIQIELNFLQAGWNEKMNSPYSYSRRLNYIQLPLMTHVCIGEGKSKFMLNFGPFVTALLSEKEKFNLIENYNLLKDELGNLVEDEDGNFIIDEDVYYGTEIDNRLEFGLCAGIGLARYTSIGIFQVEGRFNQSLSDIFNPIESIFSSSKNQIVEISISFLLDIRH